MTNIILAKPTGVSLQDHIQHVEQEMAQILHLRPFLAEKYGQRTEQSLVERCQLSAKHHDDGKQDTAWQKACQADYAVFLEKGKPQYFSAPNLRKASVRHELASLELARKKSFTLPLVVRAAIAAHHGKLARKYQSLWKPRFETFWKEIDKHLPLNNADGDPDLSASILKWYEYAGPRALLQLADHRASAREDGEILPALDLDFSYSFPNGWQKRGIQRKVEEVADQLFVLLRAPTGAGKTHTALLWAKHQIEHHRADRLVIAMPTRFTANALSIGVAEQLDTGLYHSTAWFQRLQEQSNAENRPYGFDRQLAQEQVLARKLERPVTVTTIDHLCACLTATREDHHATFFNLAHSCVVIDEADFYDSFTQTNIVVLLNVLQTLAVPVLVMSATIPESSLRFYKEQGIPFQEITEVAPEQQESSISAEPSAKKYRLRHALGDISSLSPFSPEQIHQAPTEPSSLLALLHRAKIEPTIIYANTVERVQQYYTWLRKNGVEADDIVLYHSRFTELHKVGKEQRLLSMLGKEAWESGSARGIAILTQIGEMSVNISTKFMITDICPPDRLTQRLGRSVRFDFQQEQGEIFLVTPLKNTLLYPAPYGSFERKGYTWVASEAFLAAQRLLIDGEYSPDDLVNLVNQTYPAQPDADARARNNQGVLEHCITHHWLIGPADSTTDDSDDDEYSWTDWKSRDIPTQRTVYVGVPTMLSDDDIHTSFKNWQDRKIFDIEHGVSLYAHEFAREKEGFIKATVYVRDNAQETIFLVPDRFYSEEKGLYFFEENDDNDE
jgi:CRISPR-associated endonuclease/helicase Cas3